MTSFVWHALLSSCFVIPETLGVSVSYMMLWRIGAERTFSGNSKIAFGVLSFAGSVPNSNVDTSLGSVLPTGFVLSLSS